MRQVETRRLRICWFIPEPILSRIRRFVGYSFFDPNIVLPSVWIRGFQIANYLKKMNYVVGFNTLNPLPDVAIFLRRYRSEDVELMRMLKKSGTKIVIDVVANYFQIRDRSPEGFGEASQDQVNNFLELLGSADQVWTVSPYLKDKASQVNPNSHFVSDSVDPEHFNIELFPRSSKEGPIILGWSGATSKANELNSIGPLIQNWIEQDRIRVSVITKKRPKLDFPFDFHRWDYTSFPRMISQCDICLAPRQVRNEYDLGHSLFKIGVFMAMAVPALAGPVPSYELLLDDGQAGSICTSVEEWYYHLMLLIDDEATRLSSGRIAREKMKPFLTPAVSSQISVLLENLLN